MKLKLSRKKEEVPGVTSFILEPEEPFTWRAGQYLHYTLPHESADSRKIERYFTISSAPFEKNIRITTRLSEEGSSFKKTLFDLPIGSEIDVGYPDGHFVVDDPDKEMVFIAGGIGVTPYRSILLDLDHRELPINVTLLYANRDENFVYKSDLEELAERHEQLKIHYFVSPQKIDEDAIRKLVPDLGKPIMYISGPEPMVQAFEKMLAQMGVPDDHIKRDYFPGYDWP